VAGSSAPVNRQAEKYIITSGLSLPEGFTVNYSIEGKVDWRKKGRGLSAAARRRRKRESKILFFFP
jgi:hypothetical protein